MSKRVLILADEEWVTTRALVLDLTEAGYRVDTAEDEPEIDRMLGSESFDLLIAPDRRDEGGTRSVIDRFRRARSAAKVVLLTTDGDRNDDGGSSRSIEGVTRVPKPFDLDELRSVVDRLLAPERTTSGKAT
jgi:DNA-binding response OmpR family regulator